MTHTLEKLPTALMIVMHTNHSWALIFYSLVQTFSIEASLEFLGLTAGKHRNFAFVKIHEKDTGDNVSAFGEAVVHAYL